MIIPIDEVVFFRGSGLNHQPAEPMEDDPTLRRHNKNPEEFPRRDTSVGAKASLER